MISFRKLVDNEKEYKLIYKWCSKKEVYEWFEQRILSYEEIVNKYKEKIKKQEVFIIEYNNISIGLIQIYKYDGNIDNYSNIYEYDLFIGEEKYLNKGIGKKIINQINEYIFFIKHADLIVLRPFKRNERAINCYKKCGFKFLYDYDDVDTLGNLEIISVYVKDIERWKFGIDNDKLVNLVLQGKKKATTSLLNDYDKNSIPKIGDISIITYDNNTDACVIKNTNVIITEFKNITEELAYLEGEGDNSLEYYRKNHIDYFKTIDPNFNDNTKVVFEIFEVIK
jgi:uncharacterized protein YhfF